MSFTWSAASPDVHQNGGDQGTAGKRTKTSHYNDVKAPTSTSYTHDGKIQGSSYSDAKVPVTFDIKSSTYNELLHHLPGSNNTISSWDIDGGLAADFDGSLSGLGAELGSTTYNMSEALLALPVFKQENLDNGDPAIHYNGKRKSDSLYQEDSSGPDSNTIDSSPYSPTSGSSMWSPVYETLGEKNSVVTSNRVKTDNWTTRLAPVSVQEQHLVDWILHYQGVGYQYILGAATSPAVKVNEETLTYLNQGQPYEIKLKKLGDLSEYEGYLRSTVRVCFHERRLQYMEREQLDSWMTTRPGERILDIDIPLSYGLVDMIVDPKHLNTVDFIWDPTKETGIYVKVNCISTEFTPKKHGGEKGVPFRIQVETKENDSDNSKLVHCASCQVKVFKPKGADRKHKTDREKMEKRTGSEKEKYQPSYECTVLTEIPVDQVAQGTTSRNGMPYSSSGSFGSLAQAYKAEGSNGAKFNKNVPGVDQWRWQSPSGTSPPKTEVVNVTNNRKNYPISTGSVKAPSEPSSPYSMSDCPSPMIAPQCLSIEASDKEVMAWLESNRFTQYVNVFQNFSGADLLRLTRDDLIQICGLADGIRLNNALQSRTVRPRLTVYMCQEPGTVYHAVFLENLSCQELIGKIADLIKVQRHLIRDVLVQGPSSIHIVLSDEVVRNMQEQARYWVEVINDGDLESPEFVRVLLKGIE